MSTTSKELLEKYPGYHLHSRGEITVKGKGIMKTYFLVGKDGFQKVLPKLEDDLHKQQVLNTSHAIPREHRASRKLATAEAPSHVDYTSCSGQPALMSSRDADLMLRPVSVDYSNDFITQNTPDPDKDNVSQSDKDSISMISSTCDEDSYVNCGYDTVRRKNSPLHQERRRDLTNLPTLRRRSSMEVLNRIPCSTVGNVDSGLTEEAVLAFLASKLIDQENGGTEMGEKRDRQKHSVIFTENSQTTML